MSGPINNTHGFKIEQKECVMHGLTSHKVLQGNGAQLVPDLCIKCSEDVNQYQETEKEHEKKRSSAEEQRKLNARFDNAMVAPRFRDKTFDNFKVVSKEQANALAASKWFLENIESSMGLIFIGNKGTGKNHLANAIVKEAIEKYKYTALITKLFEIDLKIKEAWSEKGNSELKAIYSFTEPGLLVVDEIGHQRGTETELLNISRVIDKRYEAMLPTILIGNVSYKDLENMIGDRAVDRFKEGGKVVVFDWKSWRGKSLHNKHLGNK